jgi:hypothetical protein
VVELLARLLVIVTLFATVIAACAPGAYAQETTIRTSADDFGAFFGEGILQVVITEDSSSAGSIEDVMVDIDADPDSGPGGSGSFAIPETSENSGRFELYLVHVDADEVDPDDIDPINTAGIEGAAGAGSTAAPIITFGPASAGADLAVEGAEDLYEEVSFDIEADDVEITVGYEESAAGLTLDRSSYGSNNVVYISVHDNDANLNPTARDEFTVDPAAAPNNDLLEISGATITQAVVFEETGDNTGVFEGRYQLGSSISASSKSVVLLLNDKTNYGATLGADENDSNFTVETSFTIGDTSGSATVNEGQTQVKTYDPVFSSDRETYYAGETVMVNITDPDANIDPNAADTIEVNIRTPLGQEEMEVIETGANTGVFALSFTLAGGVKGGDTIAVEYTDLRPTSGTQAEFSQQIQVVDLVDATPEPPSIKDVSGRPLSSLSAGQQAILSTTVKNNNDRVQPFVALIEVRDSSGVTVYLAWQTGTLNPAGEVEVGLSWKPEQAGDYEVRTFIISDLASPQVLSPVEQSAVTVN